MEMSSITNMLIMTRILQSISKVQVFTNATVVSLGAAIHYLTNLHFATNTNLGCSTSPCLVMS